uniref:Uncharacterized protein n=1 Tax=Oryza brachyantha TaxID=4533 RepID=J3MVX7_ORYBR
MVEDCPCTSASSTSLTVVALFDPLLSEYIFLVYDFELATVVHALKIRRHYLIDVCYPIDTTRTFVAAVASNSCRSSVKTEESSSASGEELGLRYSKRCSQDEDAEDQESSFFEPSQRFLSRRHYPSIVF